MRPRALARAASLVPVNRPRSFARDFFLLSMPVLEYNDYELQLSNRTGPPRSDR